MDAPTVSPGHPTSAAGAPPGSATDGNPGDRHDPPPPTDPPALQPDDRAVPRPTDPATPQPADQSVSPSDDPPASQPADAAVPPPPTPPTSSSAVGVPGPARRRSGGHVAALIVGCLLLLPGLGSLAGGTTALAAQALATDDDGYFTASIDRVASDGVAIVATDLWLDGETDVDDPWIVEWLDADVRLRAVGAGPTDEVFIGIARAADVERYLAGRPFGEIVTEIVEVDGRTPVLVDVPGDAPNELGMAAPTTQDFWVASASGSGEQELEWSVRGGRWAVVAMNADGAPGLALEVDAGVRSGLVTPVGVALIIAGAVIVAGAVTLIVVGARGRRPASATTITTPPTPR